MLLCLAVCALLPGLAVAATGEPAPVAENGEAALNIVVSPEAGEDVRGAASDLAEYLGRITGGQFKIPAHPTSAWVCARGCSSRGGRRISSGGYANLGNCPPALKQCGIYFSQARVWDKQWPVLTGEDFMGAFEICSCGWREGAGHKFFGPDNVREVREMKKVARQKMIRLSEPPARRSGCRDPRQGGKPVEPGARAIQYSSRPDANVLDLFRRSGSTPIACEQIGRRCSMTQVDPLYCDVIVQRWEEFTGQGAERVAKEENRT